MEHGEPIRFELSYDQKLFLAFPHIISAQLQPQQQRSEEGYRVAYQVSFEASEPLQVYLSTHQQKPSQLNSDSLLTKSGRFLTTF